MSNRGISIADESPYYWAYDGEPTLLLGGSSEDNLFQVPNVEDELDRLAAVGGNYVRNTMSSRDPGNVWPFAHRNGTHDLDAWNDEYWRRLRRFLDATAVRDIVVQVECWATFDFYREPWSANPFNPANNGTYTAAESGLPEVVDSHPTKTENDFFRSVPAALDLPVVREYQERFADEILAHTLNHDHVIYCIDNETSVGPEWGEYWSEYIADAAANHGLRAYTTEMWDPWDLFDAMHDATFDHPELYDYVDVSQNNHNSGDEQYENAVAQRERLAASPRPLNNVKIYGGDADFGTEQDGVERFWRNIFAGLASARFHRPPSGIGLDGRAQQMIRSAREVTNAFDTFSCTPRNDLLSGREANEAFLLADPGREYSLYFPDGGSATLTLEGGQHTCRWYDIDRSRWDESESVSGEATLSPPGRGQWIAVCQ